MQAVYEKLAIIDEYLIDHCCMVTCDRHLDGLLYVAYLTWYDDRVGAINNIHWRRHGHTSVDNCIWRKPPKLRLKAVYSDATQVELIWVASASLYFANATQLNSTSSWVELCRYRRALRQIVQKSILTPVWRPLKIFPPKVKKPTYGTELCHRSNFHCDRREISVLAQQIHIFPYKWLPGATFPCYTFLESSHRADFNL